MSKTISESYLPVFEKINYFLNKYIDQINPGLINGLEGLTLYFSYLYRLTKDDKILGMAVETEMRSIEKFNEGVNNEIGLGGLAGVYWTLKHLKEVSQIVQDKDVNDLIEKKIWESIEKDITKENYDLFFGFMGKFLALMEHNAQKEIYSNKAIEFIALVKRKEATETFWLASTPEEKMSVNLGLPHGILGIVNFLLSYSPKNNAIISDAANWIQMNIDYDKSGFFISSMDLEKKPESGGRLGWCYGNLPLAFTLLRASIYLNDKDCERKAIEALDKVIGKNESDGRVDFFENYTSYDTGLCHGTASIAYMFKKIFLLNEKNKEYLIESDRWRALTLLNLEQRLCQFDKIISTSNRGTGVECGLLNGLSGTGLALISLLDDELSEWDKVLLIS